ESTLPGAGFAYAAIMIGVFITALYSFRMYFLVFHGEERMDEHTRSHLHETPWVVTVPLILLAIPSVIIGAIFVGDMALGHFFGSAIQVLPQHDVLGKIAKSTDGAMGMLLHAPVSGPFWLAAAGVFTAWFFYMKRPDIPEKIYQNLKMVHKVLDNKYYMDKLNEIVFAGGSRMLGKFLWQRGDVNIIDGIIINGSAKSVALFSSIVRRVQTGLLYDYAFAMIIGLLLLLGLFVLK
ncbi:MAG: NADH-quinone oxidoreductase subunit L, partial [Gammaproteobacteria bacterium]|nr:NADH-quinone oxidoreductase subunit L [Gammaproteobacteria bacterium]